MKKDIIETVIVPEVPKVIPNQEVYVYSPINSRGIKPGKNYGALEIAPYVANYYDEDGNFVEHVAQSSATGEGAMALCDLAEAAGLRSRVFAYSGKAGEKAWDAVLVGQVTESNASGNFTGGLRSKSFSPYSLTYGKDCFTGVNNSDKQSFDENGQPYKNTVSINLGSHNYILESKNSDESARIAIGTGLVVPNQEGRCALGKYNACRSGVWFEFGGGYFDSINKQSVRKNVFEILDNNTFRHIGDVVFRRESASATGEVGFDIASISNGAKHWLKFPQKSGTIALAEDSGKKYLHKIRARFALTNQTSKYKNSKVNMVIDYITDRKEPYTLGTMLNTIPNIYEQQRGRCYFGDNDTYSGIWEVFFHYDENKVSYVRVKNDSNDYPYEERLMQESGVLSDKVIDL